MGQGFKREKKEKYWSETNIKPNEWDDTVRERPKEKTGVR